MRLTKWTSSTGKIAWRGKGKIRPVDTVGELPGGQKYRTYDEFKEILIRDYQDAPSGLMKNFMLYATGRLPAFADDRAEIDEIMKPMPPRDTPWENAPAVFLTDAFLAH